MNNKNIINVIIEKANAILQALNNVETKGRVNLNNLSGSMDLLEEIIKIAVDEINKLNQQIDEMKPADIEK